MTIKTQDGKVITKDGKVSCTCCEGGCCMYSAQALLDGLYTVDDLPDTLVVIGSAGTPYSCLVTKTNGSSPYYSGTCEGEQSRIIINDDNAWEFQTLSPEDGWLEPQDRSPNACLIFDPNLAGNAYIEDQFADTYTVTSCSEPSAIGTILTRTSLCYWEGQYNTPFAGTQTVSIFYCPSVGPIPSDVCNDTFKFYSFYSRDVGGLTDPIIAEKTPHSNTPSGNYTAENGSISFA